MAFFNPQNFVRIFIVVFVVVMTTIGYKVYQQVAFLKKQKRDIIYNYQDDVSDNASYSDYVMTRIKDKMQTMQEILNIKPHIKNINLAQTVHNTHLGPFKNLLDSHIIVVLVHSDVYYLDQLLLSLKATTGIQDAFLIFSHDYYCDSINSLISTVNFSKYMQIFFPYSVQLHQSVYPGKDGQFCSDGYDCIESHKRNPEAAQSKHHWWWTVNQVFDNLEVTKSANVTILFLEEGDYVAPDFLYIFKLLKGIKLLQFPFCDIISLGAYEPHLSNYKMKTSISVELWTKDVYRSGIAFNRQTWNSLKSNREEFCNHNDYNWDSSFRYVGFKKFKGYYMIAISGTRVFRLEKCDAGNDECREELKVAALKLFLKLIVNGMFPSGYVMLMNKVNDSIGTAAGLWEDIRDRELCMYFTKNCVWF
ncbi:hypothetical protein HF086_013868 [Spodoptera exigua]|uniref:Alpha-1,6-mannosyl-glycoprotein 2-beta-N-acetylglucosaminyltransferase n=1 Tax=Spodoptera exigua TaxID=7107 RepID=A0A922SG28_SPOEX|nr:hypothetical protein HF086_013868 [Spodoptera exigua]